MNSSKESGKRTDAAGDGFNMSDEDIINMFFPMVMKIAMMNVKIKSDIEDICSEVFLSYVEHHPQLKNKEHAKAWFITVTKNTIRNTYSKNEYKLRADITDEEGNSLIENISVGIHADISVDININAQSVGQEISVGYPEDSPVEAVIEMMENDEEFEKNLNELPTDQREALIFRFHYQYKFKHIAVLMGITESQAKSLVRKAERSYINVLKRNDLERYNIISRDKRRRSEQPLLKKRCLSAEGDDDNE